MRTARAIQPHVRVPARDEQQAQATTLLGEVVAQLAERIELLEVRERISRAALEPARSRHPASR
jgi:hypothetical protein